LCSGSLWPRSLEVIVAISCLPTKQECPELSPFHAKMIITAFLINNLIRQYSVCETESVDAKKTA
jgi:hypothetical protein